MTEIREITNDDLDEIIEYYERYLNSGEKIRKAITKAFDEHIYYGCKVMCDGQTAGYFTFQDGVELTCPHPDIEDKIKAFTAGMKVATVDALMVTDRFRGRGIAGQMAKWNAKNLKKRGTDVFVVEIWVYPDGSSPEKRIYEGMGRPLWLEEIPLFYKDAHRIGITCPICGDECVCGADLEIIKL